MPNDVPTLRPLGVAPLRAAFEALARQPLDVALWLTCVREAAAGAGGALSPVAARRVRAAVQAAAAAVGRCPPCARCAPDRLHLTRVVMACLTACRAASASPAQHPPPRTRPGHRARRARVALTTPRT